MPITGSGHNIIFRFTQSRCFGRSGISKHRWLHTSLQAGQAQRPLSDMEMEGPIVAEAVAPAPQPPPPELQRFEEFLASLGPGIFNVSPDSRLRSLVQHLARDERILSDTAASENIGVDVGLYRRAVLELAELCFLSDRWLRSQLECNLTAKLPMLDLLVYIDICSYDETVFTVGVQDLGVVIGPEHEVIQPAEHEPVLAHPPGVPQARRALDQLKAKILQIQSSCVLVCRFGGRLITINCPSVHCLQALARTSGALVARALIQNDARSLESNGFRSKVRVVTTDKAAYIEGAEDLVMQQRKDWTLLRLPCHIHMSSTSHVQCFGLVDNLVSGAINYALSFAMGAYMNSFRSCLRTIISERLVFLRGSPPPGAELFSQAVLLHFAAFGTHSRKRVAMLLQVCNGDWRVRTEVQHYIPLGTDLTPEYERKVKELWVNDVVKYVAGRAPKSYPRHRWLGADQAFADIALLDSIHGLASAAFMLWVGQKHMDAPLTTSASASSSSRPPVPVQQEEPHPQGVIQQPPLPDAPDHPEDAPAFVAQNAECRRKALEFVSSENVRLSCILFMVCEPLAALLQSYLHMGGFKWEGVQREAAVKSGETGNWARKFALVEASGSRLEKEFEEKVQQLLEGSAQWEVAHPDVRTAETEVLIFRLLMRARAAVYQLLTFPHSGFPYCLFKLLEHPEAAEDLLASPACLRDPYSQSFLRRYDQVQSLTSDVAIAELHAIAATTRLDIAAVEVGHSRVRRHLQAAGNNTWVPSLQLASARWILRELRRRQSTLEKLHGDQVFGARPSSTQTAQPAQQVQAALNPEPVPKKKKRVGGWCIPCLCEPSLPQQSRLWRACCPIQNTSTRTEAAIQRTWTTSFASTSTSTRPLHVTTQTS